MKIKLNIDKAAAIAVGNEHYGAQIVDVPLADIPDDLRAELAQLPEDNAGVICVSWMIDSQSRPDDPKFRACRADTDNVIATLRHRLAVRAHRQDQAAREADALIQSVLSASDADWLYEDDRRSDQKYYDPQLERWRFRPAVATYPAGVYVGSAGSWLSDDPRIVARRAEIGRDVLPAALAEWERNYKEWQRSVAEKQAQDQAARQKLRHWAEQHGSERLRKMLDLSVGDWVEVAEIEYQDAHAPEGYERGCRSGSERRKPTLAELEELERLRDLVDKSGGILSDPGLRWVVTPAEYDEDTGTETPERRYCIATVVVTAPTGATGCYDCEV